MPLDLVAAKTTAKRPWIKYVLIVLGTLLLVLLVAGSIALHYADPYLHQRAIAMLEEKFHSDVELKEFHTYLFPALRVEGAGLALRKNGRSDVPPLIEIKSFSADASLLRLFASPWRIVQIRLQGLVITIPPKTGEQPREYKTRNIPIYVAEIVSDDAKLILLPKDPAKLPHEFDIHHLVMRSVGLGHAASFNAQLTNDKPPGQIDTKGSFGPWAADDPGQTPLSATYTFNHADLGVFKGIGGILSSSGKFGGILQEIEVEGETHTPDFVVDTGGHPVSLDTSFRATVDGTNGNTILHPVKAHFLNSYFTAAGPIIKTKQMAGRRVTLDVDFYKGRMEDLMRLAVKGDKPIMTGDMKFKAKFDLPSGKQEDGDVTERINLDGIFGVGNAQFTSPKVQEKLETFSRKAQGKPEDDGAGSSVSQLRGRFHMNNGTIDFRRLSFSVPGAQVSLDGSYGLKSEALDFHGKLRMDAKISQTTTGIKSFFLKAVDPFFRKNGQTEIPIKITGSREHPSFGLELHQEKAANQAAH
ncbi:MAG TPA: AsmA-like C-terminal region-containing protein [Terriglobales bacterium]